MAALLNLDLETFNHLLIAWGALGVISAAGLLFGGLFRWVSCPNYFGEILEWVGFALMSWSLMGLVYAAWVALPLIAQARNAHRWYRGHFPDYPPERRAVFPGLL